MNTSLGHNDICGWLILNNDPSSAILLFFPIEVDVLIRLYFNVGKFNHLSLSLYFRCLRDKTKTLFEHEKRCQCNSILLSMKNRRLPVTQLMAICRICLPKLHLLICKVDLMV